MSFVYENSAFPCCGDLNLFAASKFFLQTSSLPTLDCLKDTVLHVEDINKSDNKHQVVNNLGDLCTRWNIKSIVLEAEHNQAAEDDDHFVA